MQENLLLLFCGGFLVATVVEYAIAVLLEKLFHASWWDYSKKKFNIKGRVCLERSVEWGLLTVFVMRLIQPAVEMCIRDRGRTEQNTLVHFSGSKDLIGQMVPVKIIENKTFYVIGERI